MKEKKIRMRDALKLIKDKRSIACPNPGFTLQLKEYELDIFSGQGSYIKMEK